MSETKKQFRRRRESSSSSSSDDELNENGSLQQDNENISVK
jgi:hypothetical protein